MRVAYYSPLPPERSGIADYSALLLPALGELVEIVLVRRGRTRPVAADVALYHVGNDPEAHGWIVDATGKACTTVEGVPLGNLLEPGPVRSVADDDTPERGIRGKRVEEQLVPLRTVEAADGQHEVVVALGPVGQLLRRMGHHLRRDPGRALESLGDVP